MNLILAHPKKLRRSNDTGVSKFYAVRTGMKPGVYSTWKECHQQINKFKGACYKAFTTYKDAQDFVSGKSVEKQPSSAKSKIFYGVAVGHCPGVYTDWTVASLQIKDVKGPKYKKFLTRNEAEYFVMTEGKELENYNVTQSKRKIEEVGAVDEEDGREEDEEEGRVEDEEEPFPKRIKISMGDSSRNMELDENTIKVYTDGSSRRNGQTEARAGVGVFFGTNDPRNVSEPLQGERQTNQRAELTAVIRALQIWPEKKNIQIVTDSIYSINCLTEWYKRWLKKNWITSSGSPVINQDLIKAVRTLIDRRSDVGATTEFIWVRAHNNEFGNEAADCLAVAGSNKAL